MATSPRRAALYLRSSKDRSDVSIDAQRRELQNLARDRGLLVVAEYADVVESAKSEHRPAFQALIRDLRRRDRGWEVLLVVDTSRLSRRRYVAQVFKHEAAKHGVEIVYSKLPETDPISQVILEAVFEAMDEVHSLMSREKGLAGMAENVRQGWRAGGRAPRGYRLKRVETGAVREGRAVTKSVLEPSDEAPLVARYLKARAAGTPRAVARRELGIPWPATSLIAMEWNALTYAGHTVWNRHNELEPGGGYRGGRKMRPRSEWHVTRDTHEALITDEEAEAILAQLEGSAIGEAVSRAKRGLSDYLLTGILQAPDGRPWEGVQRRWYRTRYVRGHRSRQVSMDAVDAAVVGQLVRDLTSPAFIRALVREARRLAGASDDPGRELRRQMVALNGQISRAMELALQMEDPAPALRKVEELEARRKQLSDEIERLEAEQATRRAMRSVGEAEIRSLVEGLAEELQEAERPRLKGLIAALIERVTLDPEKLTCRIHYRIPAGVYGTMASPTGFEPVLQP